MIFKVKEQTRLSVKCNWLRTICIDFNIILNFVSSIVYDSFSSRYLIIFTHISLYFKFCFSPKIDEIYRIDEQIDQKLKEEGAKLAEIEGDIISCHKKITDMECPRDDSMDNNVVLWCSDSFAPASNATIVPVAAGSGVSALRSSLEDAGLTVRGCSSVEDTILKANDLLERGTVMMVVMIMGFSPRPSLRHY